MANKRINTGFSILGLSTSGISRILSHSLWLSYTDFSTSSICRHLLGSPVPPASLVYPTINQVPYFLFKNLFIFLIVSCFINHKCLKHYTIWQTTAITLKHEQTLYDSCDTPNESFNLPQVHFVASEKTNLFGR